MSLVGVVKVIKNIDKIIQQIEIEPRGKKQSWHYIIVQYEITSFQVVKKKEVNTGK